VPASIIEVLRYPPFRFRLSILSADDFLTSPYPFYAELREAGPVVWLERYGVWACARHAEVQAALSDWQTFSSAAGVGIDDFRTAESDP
jgi:cytochrome P450